MSNLEVYNPKLVQFVWGGVVLEGVAEGTFIEASRNADNSQRTIGAYGDVSHTKIADKTGTLTVTFLQQSDSNKIFSAVQQLQDRTDDLIRLDATVIDKSGGFLCYAKAAHITTPAAMALADDTTSKAWTWFVDELDYADTIPEVAVSAGKLSVIASGVSAVEAAILTSTEV